MPDLKIKTSFRETVMELNGKPCLVFCVEIGNHYFPPRAMHYLVKMNEEDALFTRPSEDNSTLFAWFPVRVPAKGKLTVTYPGEPVFLTLAFDLEKRKPELLERKRLPGNVVEIKERKQLFAGR